MTMQKSEAVHSVSVGHTPDMDDAFMFYGIDQKTINMRGLAFEHVIEDIQALNERSAKGDLDMTAISAAGYPDLCDKYAIAAVGSSVGNNYGPLLVATQKMSMKALKGKTIAVPGLQTTACLLLRLALPDVNVVPMAFTDVPQATLDGNVDAGLVIHEWQLTYSDSTLTPIKDLGVWWHEQFNLPIPLGLNVISRKLDYALQEDIVTVFHDSIRYALDNPEAALAFAMKYARGTDAQRSRKFVGMYVNEQTTCFPENCRASLKILYEQAYQAGLISKVPPIDVIEAQPL